MARSCTSVRFFHVIGFPRSVLYFCSQRSRGELYSRNIPHGNTGQVTVTKVTNWTGGTPVGTIDAWWEITPTNASGWTLTLTLCYLDSENSKGVVLPGLMFWRYEGTSWGNGIAPSSTYVDSHGNNCATVSGITALSRWTLSGNEVGPGNTPTAVSLSSFKANTPFDLGAWLRKILGR